MGLLAVHAQALPNGSFPVIVPLDERIAGLIIGVRYARRVEAHVIGTSAGFVHAAPGDSHDDDVVGDADRQDMVDRDIGFGECFCLGDRAREAVEQETVSCSRPFGSAV